MNSRQARGSLELELELTPKLDQYLGSLELGSTSCQAQAYIVKLARAQLVDSPTCMATGSKAVKTRFGREAPAVSLVCPRGAAKANK
uniref:Uncharacterized protein n=1 Tax=Oryza rufipogon TaxID=4529 RepID=A0A0E0QJN5_ORYRU